MKKRIAIYGGTELSAAESWFVVSLTYALLTSMDVIVVTGGFLYAEPLLGDSSDKILPGDISTDFSVLQGAIKYVTEKGINLKDCLETWLPDPEVEDDPKKKNVVRFKEGYVKELVGESAQIRRFSMVRDVDALITIKGKKHTAVVLDFALTMNKPALPLAFTSGDSLKFWTVQKDRVKKWFDISNDFAAELETKNVEVWTPGEKNEIIKKIIAAVATGIEKESSNEEYYKTLRKKFASDENSDQKATRENSIADKQATKNEISIPKKQLSMFLSYSHKDGALKDELDKHLTALKRSQKISIWQDKNIEGGAEWDETIKKELQDADIILLLISPDFIASKYIMDIELEYALQLHEQGKAKVIPIFLRSVFTKDMPFEKLQGYISKDSPISSFPERERDGAFFKVVERISSDIDKWLAK